jgi:hypothetical protein
MQTVFTATCSVLAVCDWHLAFTVWHILKEKHDLQRVLSIGWLYSWQLGGLPSLCVFAIFFKNSDF